MVSYLSLRTSVRLLITLTLSVAVTVPAIAASGKQCIDATEINLPDGWRPEGITAGRKNALYIGSLADGAIWRTNTCTGNGSVLSLGTAGRVAVGLDFDRRHNRLWVAGGSTGEVHVVDARSGQLLQTYTVAGASGVGFLNDVVVTRKAVYVTDSQRSLLVVIPTQSRGKLPAPGAVTTLPLTNDAIGNGIVAIDKWLVIVQSATGLLFRVDPKNGIATPIDLGGYLVTNGDGLEPGRHRDLFVVRNRSNLIAKIKFDGNEFLRGHIVREITDPRFDIPSTAALLNKSLWVVNARFGTAPTPLDTATYSVNRVDLRK